MFPVIEPRNSAEVTINSLYLHYSSSSFRCATAIHHIFGHSCISKQEIKAAYSEAQFFLLARVWKGKGEKILLQSVQPRSACLLQLSREFWFANFCVPTGALTRVHTWLYTNRPNRQHLKEMERARPRFRPTLWCSLNHQVYFDMQIWPQAAFCWPFQGLGRAPETPPLIWHDLIWRISVLLLLLDVWTHMRGVRLREVCYESWCETTQWTVPGAKERGGGGERAGKRGTIRLNNTSDRKEWKGEKKEKGFGECGSDLCESESLGRVSSTSTVFPWPPHPIPLLLCWKSLSFDSCAWSAVTAVWREGCVCLAVCCLIVCSECGQFCVHSLGMQILMCVCVWLQGLSLQGKYMCVKLIKNNNCDWCCTLWLFNAAHCALKVVVVVEEGEWVVSYSGGWRFHPSLPHSCLSVLGQDTELWNAPWRSCRQCISDLW